MNTATTPLPSAAVTLIEQLLDTATYGKRNMAGNYHFPLSRNARIRTLQRDYGIAFPLDLPEPYLTRYYSLIDNKTLKQ